MREYLTSVAGNEALRRRLCKDLEDGSLSHAYIIEGPADSGKSTLAMALSMALACQNRSSADRALPCGECDVCQKIASGNSPDVMHVYREEGKATMGVDVVRALRADVHTVPNDLSFKVYLIHDAHTMTQQAQNAFLLTLEEPPAFVMFFLLAEDASVLLETIRSRAPILRMQPVGEQEIEAYLLSPAREPKLRNAAAALKADAPDDFAAIVRMANGCIGTAIELLDGSRRTSGKEHRVAVSHICELLAERTRPDELLSSVLAFGTNREEVGTKLSFLEMALRDLLLLTYSDTATLVFFTNRDLALDLCTRFTARRLVHIASTVREAARSLAANANVRLLLVQLHSKLSRS